MKKHIYNLIFLSLLLFLFVAPVSAYYSPGSPTHYTNDFADVLTDSEEETLNALISNFEKEKETEIAVVTINSLEGDTIENFSNELFREWGIGKEKYDNGVLLLVAIEDRAMRIEVGYGLEGALTDIESKYILEYDIKPLFKAGDYYGGIKSGVENIIKATKEEIFTEPEYDYGATNEKLYLLIPIGIMFLWFLIVASGILAGSKAWWPGGVIGGIAGVIGGFVSSVWWALPIFILAGLGFDYLVSRIYNKLFKGKGGGKGGSSGSSWWSGGSSSGGSSWSGGSSSSGSSFGGFGGGSSGGGGASSSW